MNWILYIFGWALGWALVKGLLTKLDPTPRDVWIEVASYTGVWIWLCWRFIA